MDKRLLGFQPAVGCSRRGGGTLTRGGGPCARPVKMNGGRQVTGVLRGFDAFMNIVLDEAIEEVSPTEKHAIGMVVRLCWPMWRRAAGDGHARGRRAGQMVRGNCILMMEALQKIVNPM